MKQLIMVILIAAWFYFCGFYHGKQLGYVEGASDINDIYKTVWGAKK